MDELIGKNGLQKSKSLPSERYLHEKQNEQMDQNRIFQTLQEVGNLEIRNVNENSSNSTKNFGQNIVAIKKLSKQMQENQKNNNRSEESDDSANGSITRSNRHFFFVLTIVFLFKNFVKRNVLNMVTSEAFFF